eukprot:jgi/Ulvmu1/5969/UM026_0093.1
MLADFEAMSIAEAVAEAAVAGGACGRCPLATELVARSYAAIILPATAASVPALIGPDFRPPESTAQRAENFVS